MYMENFALLRQILDSYADELDPNDVDMVSDVMDQEDLPVGANKLVDVLAQAQLIVNEKEFMALEEIFEEYELDVDKLYELEPS